MHDLTILAARRGIAAIIEMDGSRVRAESPDASGTGRDDASRPGPSRETRVFTATELEL